MEPEKARARERASLLADLVSRYGRAQRLGSSISLYEIGDGRARVYVRYSKLHAAQRTFYGLRQDELRQLEGHKAFIAFLWEGQEQPLFLPFDQFEEVFAESHPASDGQHKVQILLRDDATILYVARVGRFNVEGHFGWLDLDRSMVESRPIPPLSHSQVQTLLAGIGNRRQFDVWIPLHDRPGLDWSLTPAVPLMERLPSGFEAVQNILGGIDVVWVKGGAGGLAGAYEIEHSTPIYSGLLRLNDIRLINSQIDRLTIVSNEPRRAAFIRQLNRPTFNASSLSSVCTFLEYSEVYDWHARLLKVNRK